MKILNWLLYGSISEIWPKIVLFKPSDVTLEPLGTKIYSKVISGTISSKKHINGGCSARYYQISPTKGIKLFHYEYPTFKDVIESSLYEEVLKETSLLRKAKSRFSNIPKCYGVRVISKDGSFRIGIVMQHLGETPANDLNLLEDFHICSYDLIKTLSHQLKEHGITHSDLHLNNIMRHKNEWWIIDFDSEYVTINP